jgi:hypothetical protein
MLRKVYTRWLLLRSVFLLRSRLQAKKAVKASRSHQEVQAAAAEASAAFAKARRMLSRAASMRRQLDGRLGATWQEFEAAVEVLVAAGALSELYIKEHRCKNEAWTPNPWPKNIDP